MTAGARPAGGEIHSPRNPKIVAAAKLRTRGGRERAGRFLVEGPGPVREAIAAGCALELYADSSGGGPAAAAAEAGRAAGLAVHMVSAPALGRLAGTVTPRGPVAVCSFVDVALAELPANRGPVVVLDRVRDPGNVGTIVRTADAAGAGAVLVSEASVDVYNEKAVRASAGSLFHLPIARDVELGAALDLLRSRGYRILAAAADGRLSVFDLPAPESRLAVVFGNESTGASAEVRGGCDDSLRVPMRGAAESLNVGAAVAVVLFEIARGSQRIPETTPPK